MKTNVITFKDRLSHLNYTTACKLLGPEGKRLIREGGKYNIDIGSQVHLDSEKFILHVSGAMAFIEHDLTAVKRLKISCSRCEMPCEHTGAALSLILEEKMTLGLSAPPKERVPVESLNEEDLIQQAIREREESALKNRLRLKPLNKKKLWSDYLVTNHESGKTYRTALRGWERGESFCSCPDYRKNTLGTCKHILYALSRVKTRFGKSTLNRPFQPVHIALYLRYGLSRELRLLVPKLSPREQKILKPFLSGAITDIHGLMEAIKNLETAGREVILYPDAEQYINEILYREKVKKLVGEIRGNPQDHSLRKQLLKAELLPYQLDGIAFAVGAGRAVLADDMGLGKTIQGIGVSELLNRMAGIKKVMIVCPTSVKSQWKSEIERFSNRNVQIVMGSAEQRALQYDNTRFFTICNYEQVLRDRFQIERCQWDLIILDEGQRIKNWEAKTSRTIKSLRSPFALVLSGTPLENRLEELHSVVEFIDDRRLGPAFRFYNTYRVVDDKGKVLGYKNLKQLRKALGPVMLRRTREDVMGQLPPRTTEIRRIPPTSQQLDFHDGQKKILAQILAKRYLTEMDLLRIQKCLLLCRMVADSTFLVDKQEPGYSTKLPELESLLSQLVSEDGRKIILFSEWTTMLDLIEPVLNKLKAGYVRLDGSVPQKKRPPLVNRFQNDDDCRLFLTTNAGSTGLNLQAADTVINVDLPWNPAVLEQRIARAHRMGQKRPVHTFLLVTEETLEENLLATLSAKKQLSLAVLDPNSKIEEVNMDSGIEELKKRLEILLGQKPPAPVDEAGAIRAREETDHLERREKISAAGGQMLQAALAFMGQLLPNSNDNMEQIDSMAESFKRQLEASAEPNGNGGLRLNITLDDRAALDTISRTLAKIAAGF